MRIIKRCKVTCQLCYCRTCFSSSFSLCNPNGTTAYRGIIRFMFVSISVRKCCSLYELKLAKLHDSIFNVSFRMSQLSLRDNLLPLSQITTFQRTKKSLDFRVQEISRRLRFTTLQFISFEPAGRPKKGGKKQSIYGYGRIM